MISISSVVKEAVNGCRRGEPTLEALIVLRLEDAGRVFLALPDRGPSLDIRTGHPDVVHDATEAYGYVPIQSRPPIPSSIRITRMEEALKWIALIPDQQHKLRRIVGRRMLVHPVNDKHLYSWRTVGKDMGIDHHTAQRWHTRGICVIATALRHHSVSV